MIILDSILNSFQDVILFVSLGLLSLGGIVCFIGFLRNGLKRLGVNLKRMPNIGGLLLGAMLLVGISNAFSKGTNSPPTSTNSPPAPTNLQPTSFSLIPNALEPNAFQIDIGFHLVSTVSNTVNDFTVPSNAVIQKNWYRRGAYQDCFTIAPSNWFFSVTNDGTFIDSVVVFSYGEFQPNVREKYFPRPFVYDLSIVPESNFDKLPSGINESFFWYSQTPSNSLLLTWHNALSNRLPENAVCFQAELWHDGSFEYRYQDRTEKWRTVFPFDYDGDGLENLVDLEPYIAHSHDCHGANAKWYEIACSNVFTSVTNLQSDVVVLPNGETACFQTNVNENAYYFVDVVLDKGFAPIYFNADHDSWLGSPIIVAYGGETNRVPLLIGVEYAITSSVPFFVSVSDFEYATIVTNNARSFTVKCPIEFEFIEELGGNGRSYSIDVKPFNPGGEFVWETEARTRLSSCWYGLGDFVFSGCSTCVCEGCSASGSFRFEGTRFDFTGGWCGCYEHDEESEDEDNGNDVTTNMNFASSVSVSVDKSAIVFEDEYSNDYDDTKPRCSTWSCVTVQFAAGSSDASCSVELTGGESKVVMHENSKSGSPCTSKRYNLKKNLTVTKKFYLEGVGVSSSVNDIQIRASISGGGSDSDSVDLTVYEVKVVPKKYISEDLMCRHEVGIGEEVEIELVPNIDFAVTPQQGQMKEMNLHIVPFEECKYNLEIGVSDASFTTELSSFEPKKYVAISEPEIVAYSIASNQAGCFGMKIPIRPSPTNVCFSALEFQEVSASNSSVTGYFASSDWQKYWYHDDNSGGGRWMDGDNVIDDYAEIFLCSQSWSNGTLIWHIPLAWRVKGNLNLIGVVFDEYTQTMEIESDGLVSIRKLNWKVERIRNHYPILSKEE